MTETATRRNVGSMPGPLAARIARLQRQLSDRVHADGAAFAGEQGWAIATTSGRFGFGTGTYHEPRFRQRAASARRGPEEGTGWRPNARSA